MGVGEREASCISAEGGFSGGLAISTSLDMFSEVVEARNRRERVDFRGGRRRKMPYRARFGGAAVASNSTIFHRPMARICLSVENGYRPKCSGAAQRTQETSPIGPAFPRYDCRRLFTPCLLRMFSSLCAHISTFVHPTTPTVVGGKHPQRPCLGTSTFPCAKCNS